MWSLSHTRKGRMEGANAGWSSAGSVRGVDAALRSNTTVRFLQRSRLVYVASSHLFTHDVFKCRLVQLASHITQISADTPRAISRRVLQHFWPADLLMVIAVVFWGRPFENDDHVCYQNREIAV
jgi:hypothetical protein